MLVTTQGQYTGIVENRSTTDIIFLLLLFAMWVCMCGVGGDAVTRGIYRVLYLYVALCVAIRYHVYSDKHFNEYAVSCLFFFLAGATPARADSLLVCTTNLTNMPTRTSSW
jgi:hypothetical protein